MQRVVRSVQKMWLGDENSVKENARSQMMSSPTELVLYRTSQLTTHGRVCNLLQEHIYSFIFKRHSLITMAAFDECTSTYCTDVVL